MLTILLWREHEASSAGVRQALQVPTPRGSMDVEPLPKRSIPKLRSLAFIARCAVFAVHTLVDVDETQELVEGITRVH